MGVAAFEGLLPTEQDRHEADTMDLLENTATVVDELISRELLPERFIVTAGGSAVFDLVVKAFANRWPNRATVILRSGCYVTQDHGLYCASSPLAHDDDPLEQALELWTYVQSRPESNLAYAAFGRRDAPFDSGYPMAIACVRRGEAVRRPVTGIIVEELNDQHARLRLNDGIDLEVGDTIIFGIAHPCSAFDRWRLVMEVDDDDRVIGGLRTFF
jgi:D-serine deaminase-like pyridoxal phosphate-dependent protein